MNEASQIMITGGSAGALAVYLHYDYMMDELILPRMMNRKQLQYYGAMPDSGFFMAYENETMNFVGGMQWIYTHQNASRGVNDQCVQYWGGALKEGWKCMFAQYTAPFMKHRMWPLQGQYDSWQVQYILGSSDAAMVNEYGRNLSDTYFDVMFRNNAQNGVFMDSCYHHDWSWNYCVNGTDEKHAVVDWFYSLWGVNNSDGQYTWFQNDSYPCHSCCHSCKDHGDDGTSSVNNMKVFIRFTFVLLSLTCVYTVYVC